MAKSQLSIFCCISDWLSWLSIINLSNICKANSLSIPDQLTKSSHGSFRDVKFRIEAFAEDQSCITLKAVSSNVTVEPGRKACYKP